MRITTTTLLTAAIVAFGSVSSAEAQEFGCENFEGLPSLHWLCLKATRGGGGGSGPGKLTCKSTKKDMSTASVKMNCSDETWTATGGGFYAAANKMVRSHPILSTDGQERPVGWHCAHDGKKKPGVASCYIICCKQSGVE